MGFRGKVALFVEGSQAPQRRRVDALTAIWGVHFVQSLGLVEFSRIIPISKRDFAAMDPLAPVSGRGIPLPQRIAAELEKAAFDIAVVAWDLQPPWRPDQPKCRWDESLLLYRSMSVCDALPTLWREHAADRLQEMESREAPSARTHRPKLEKGEVLTVCMEPTFESILTICERTLRDIFDIEDSGRVGWPHWSLHKNDPERLLKGVLKAAQSRKPRPKALNQVNGDMITAKNEWGEYILRKLLEDKHCRQKLLSHPLPLRLVDLLARDR